jgi:hypothetical protein
MAEFLSLTEARGKRDAVRSHLSALMSSRALVVRQRARQWRFLSACVERLISPKTRSEFDRLSPTAAAQLKFEIEDRLRHFYIRDGRPLELVFHLVHRRDFANFGLGPRCRYPTIAGYALLVRDLSSEVASAPSRAGLAAFLERVVTEAIDAEFAAYAALPEVVPEELLHWYVEDSSAYRRIMAILTRHRERGWVISNPYNPSRKRLLSIKVRALTADEATIGTVEYWCLRWWDINKHTYTYPYQETNRQTYVLRKERGGWKVFDCLMPSPRSSLPYHRIKRS